MLIGMNVISWTNSRSVDDLVGGGVQEFVGDGITDMFTKINLEGMFFFTSEGERLVMGCIVNRFVESVHHNDADLRVDTIKFGERDVPFQRVTRNLIE